MMPDCGIWTTRTVSRCLLCGVILVSALVTTALAGKQKEIYSVLFNSLYQKADDIIFVCTFSKNVKSKLYLT